MRNKLISIICDAQNGEEIVNLGAIADALIKAGVIKDTWVSINAEKPSDHLRMNICCDYLCTVLIPTPGGSFRKEVKVLSYDHGYDRWNCEDMIVTHWMPAIKPAE